MEASEVSERVRKLVLEQRATCLWFLREDLFPSGPAETLRVLEHIKRNGNRQAFVEASELAAWLSRDSSETSAAL